MEHETSKNEKTEIEKLKQENEFLRKRENKLQKIEQIFKKGSVDLGDLERLVLEK